MGFFGKKDAPDIEAPVEQEIVEVMDAPESFITFSKPYQFEGQEYFGLDMDCLDSLTTKDLTDAERLFNKTGNFVTMPELNMQFIKYLMTQATKLPIEFFDRLPAKEWLAIKNRVIADFFSDGE